MKLFGIALTVFLLLAASIAAALFRPLAPPATPVAMSTPPEVEEGFHAVNSVSRIFDVEVGALRRWMDEGQMVKVLRSTEAVARPAEVTYLAGKWPELGAVRRVKLEDGHYVLERVLASKFPGVFRYQVWGFTGSAGSLVKYATGEFRYVSLGATRTRLTWTYRLRPKSILLRSVLDNFLRNRFASFMSQGVELLKPPTDLGATEIRGRRH